jgi:autotransporter-associated beta strand protein
LCARSQKKTNKSKPLARYAGAGALLAAVVAASPRVSAANLYWDPANTTNGGTVDPGNGPWDLSTTIWNNSTIDVAWTQTSATAATNAAFFAGTDGTYNINVAADVAAQTLNFTASGYVFTSTAPQTIFTGGVYVNPDKTETIGANVTLSFSSSLYLLQPNVSRNKTGTLNIENGGTVQTTGGGALSIVGTDGVVNVNTGGTLRTGTGPLNVAQPSTIGTGATLNVNGGSVSTAGGPGIVVSNGNSGTQYLSAVGTLNVNSGTVTIGGTGALIIAGGTSSTANTSTGTVNINGGVVTTGSGGVSLALPAQGTGTLNLNGGTLNTNKIFKTAGTGTVNFNGGTLVATASNATYMQDLTAANVKSGGTIINTNGFNIGIAQPLLGSAGDGGLIKNGAGTLTLGGVNTYTGATVINAGGLQVDGSLDAASAVNVAGGATLSGSGTIGGAVTAQSGARVAAGSLTTPGTLNVGALTLNAGSSLDFQLGSSGSDLINVLNSGGLTLGGSTINLFGDGGVGVAREAGTYTLLDYTGTLNGSVSNLNIANQLAGKQYTLFNDTVNSLIGLTIADLRSDWTGGAGDNTWTTAANWNGVVPNTAGYNARFGTAGTPTTVQVSGAKTVGAITFDNSAGSYTLSGGASDIITLNAGSASTAALNVDSGSHFIAAPLVLQSDTAATLADQTMLTVSGNISGAKNLGVFGPGTLVLTGTNSYATTSVSNGKLQIGDGGTAGTLGMGDVTVNTGGVLSVNRGDTVTINNNIGGANGAVSQDGSGTLVLGGVNTFGTTAGGLIVNAGTVQLGSATGLATGAIVTLNNGTLDLNGFDATSSAYSGTEGTTVTDTSGAAGTSTLVLNQAANSTISSAILDGATRKVGLTKLGNGNVTLDGALANTYTGLTTITQGTLTLGKSGVQAIGGNVQIGDGVDSDVLSVMASDQIADSSVITFTAGPSGSSAFLRLNGNNETIQGIQTTVGNAAVIENGTGGTGTLTVNTAGHDYTYDGILRNSTGILALTKTGDGTLTLANSAKVVVTNYTGTTTIDGGSLVLDNLDSFSSPITVNSTAANALTFNQTTRNLTISDTVPITGTGGVTKTGIGTLTIANGQSYTGPTTVAGGTLLLNGSLDPASTVTVANGGTLSGTGSAQGTVIVQSGGHLSPGTATTPGTPFFGGLTLEQGSLLDFELSNSSSDQLYINNPDSLTLNGGAFNLFGPGGTTPLTTNGTYTLIDYNNTFLGQLSNLTVNNPLIGKLYTFTDDPNNTLISLTVADNASEWNGNAGDGKWSTTGNWTAGVPNSFGVKAFFGQIPPAPTTVAVNGPKLVSGIVFDNYNGYDLTGGAADIITMDAGTGNAAIEVVNGSHSIDAPIALNSNLIVRVGPGWMLGVNGSITGATKSLTLENDGTLVLGGTNTYAATLVNSGTLQVGSGGASGTLGQGDVTVGATGKLSFNRSDAVTVANNIGGASGTVSQDGSGTLILTGNNTFGTLAGGLIVNNGAVKLGSATAVSPITLTTINNGTLDINGMNATIGSLGGFGGVLTDNGTTAGTSTLRILQTTATTFSGAINDGPVRKIALIKDGTGVLTLDGSALNTYTGGTTITGGTLMLGKFGGNAIVGDVLIGDTIGSDALKLAASDQIPDTSVLTFNAGGNQNSAFFQLNGNNETVQGIQTTVGNAAVIENTSTGADSMLTVDTAGHDYTYDGILRDSGAKLGLTKSGKGTLTLANTVRVATTSNTGDTIINDGKIVLDNLDAFSSPITNNSPEPDALTFNQGIKNMVIGGGVLISGTGGVTKTGPFFLKMTAPSTYAGDTKILDGTIIAANSTALPSGAGKGNVVIDGGATVAGTLDIGGNDLNINGLSGASGTVLGQVINSGAAAGTLTVGNGDATASFAGIIRDNAGAGSALGLSKTGTGIQTLSGASTYSGATNIDGGTLRVSGSIANSSGVNVNTGTFEAASSQTVRSLTVASGAVARVTNAAAATVLKVGDNVNTAPLSVSGQLDLKTNGLIVDVADGSDGAALTSVRGLILSGYNPSTPGGSDGKWDGNGILSSSITSGNAIGYALASEVTSATGGSFMETSVDGSAVVARYTLAGDATLDGSVDFNDLVKLAQNYNTTVSAGSESWWNHGDFTYDGITDFNDLVKLAQNYNTALPTEPVPGASAAFEADLARAFASVPEPSMIGFVGIGLIGLANRRRRRNA